MKLTSLDTVEEKAKLRSAIENRDCWVIRNDRRNATDWYFLVFLNLTCKYQHEKHWTYKFVHEYLNNGLNRNAFERFRTLLDLTSEELAQTLGISARTLARRETTFKGDESERLFRVALVFQKTLEVFEDIEKARRWIKSPKRALGDSTPLEYCRSELGAEEVRHLLGRLEHGVFS